MDLKVAVVQADPRVGDLRANLEAAKKAVRDNPDADLVVLPESFLVGYPADDLVLNSGFMQGVSRAVVELGAFVRDTAGPALLVGAPEPGANLPFNAAHFFEPDGTRHVVRKLNLPNDGPFDEKRTFAAGEERGPIAFRGWRIGVVICEEMWSEGVCRRLAGDLADVLVVINGSPYTRDKHLGDRMGHARRRVAETGLPLVYANLVGGQDELVFDGGSFVLQADGTLLHNLPFFEPATMRLSVTKQGNGRSLQTELAVDPETRGWDMPHGREWLPPQLDYVANVVGLRDYAGKLGFGRMVLGVSGGADSALALAMAVDAVGAANVVGLTLPSRLTDDKPDAYAVAEALGVRLVEIPIGPAVEAVEAAFRDGLAQAGLAQSAGVTLENVQARLRMVQLMAWSNDTGALLVTTGNKSECSVGYATLYGDMAGGFNPVKDLYKTDVWRLMRERNDAKPAEWMLGPDRDCLPVRVIDKVPTAGLAAGQTDEARLGPYPVLDAFLRRLVDEQVGAVEAVNRVRREDAPRWKEDWSSRYVDVEAWSGRYLNEDYALATAALVQRAEYKRRQAAPGTKIGPRAYGRDRRYPIVNGWDGLI